MFVPHSETLLLGIRKRAFDLYTQAGVPVPDNYNKASVEFGIPNNEDALTEVIVEIRDLEEKIRNTPPPQKTRKLRKKIVPAPSEPPETSWCGETTIKGHRINLAKLNARDGRLAAAGKD